MTDLFAYFLAILVGISLGLIGGGGSILTVPILVYFLHIPTQLATSYSLCVVGVSSLIAVRKHVALGNIDYKASLWLGIPAVLCLVAARRFFLPMLPNILYQSHSILLTKDLFLLIVFAILMVFASISMIMSKSNTTNTMYHTKLSKLVWMGLSIGLVTGLLGAGGGFLIIPALVLWANLPMKKAIGTSLFIICLNTSIGFIFDMLHGLTLDYTILIVFTLFAIAGIFIGIEISKKVNGHILKPFFGWFILCVGVCIIIKELFSQL